MIKCFRWLGAVFMVFVWIIGKLLIGEMERLGKFVEFGDLFSTFIYVIWIFVCVVLFLWIKPNSEKKEELELKMEMKRQGKRRKSKERRKI